LIDLYPTLMELCGIEPPKGGLDGQSLVPLLRNPAMETGRAVVSTFYGEHYSVRDARWRYLRYADGSEELYDHATDPNEWRNQASQPEHAAIKARLARSIPTERVVVKPDPNSKKKRP
jgi:arylsulfatase A-like enzyme